MIGVSGIGPKGGLNILACMTPDELRFAIMSGDAKAISAAPGIGKKTAEKLILELRDKVDIEDVLEHAAHGDDNPAVRAGDAEKRYAGGSGAGARGAGIRERREPARGAQDFAGLYICGGYSQRGAEISSFKAERII